MSRMDFVTIVFDNQKEIDLLKIQLISFTYVDPNIINNIYVLFNDAKEKVENYIPQILNQCPADIIKNLKILYVEDLIGKKLEEKYPSDWWSQQAAKLLVSKIVTTEKYIVLDAKNHFITDITYETFFNDKNQAIIYNAIHNDELMEWYKCAFTYFNLDNIQNHNPFHDPLYIQTTTPFVFVKEHVEGLIKYVEEKEEKLFFDFFYGAKKYTEFFFYYAYICSIDKKDEYVFIPRQIDNAIIGPHDPNIHEWNSWKSKCHFIVHDRPSLFSLSSKCVGVLDKEYKDNIKMFYRFRFYNLKIDNLIATILDS